MSNPRLTPLYFITNGEFYIHYVEETEAYVVGEGVLGACVFDKTNAQGILDVHLDDSWYTKKVTVGG